MWTAILFKMLYSANPFILYCNLARFHNEQLGGTGDSRRLPGELLGKSLAPPDYHWRLLPPMLFVLEFEAHFSSNELAQSDQFVLRWPSNWSGLLFLVLVITDSC